MTANWQCSGLGEGCLGGQSSMKAETSKQAHCCCHGQHQNPRPTPAHQGTELTVSGGGQSQTITNGYNQNLKRIQHTHAHPPPPRRATGPHLVALLPKPEREGGRERERTALWHKCCAAELRHLIQNRFQTTEGNKFEAFWSAFHWRVLYI